MSTKAQRKRKKLSSRNSRSIHRFIQRAHPTNRLRATTSDFNTTITLWNSFTHQAIHFPYPRGITRDKDLAIVRAVLRRGMSGHEYGPMTHIPEFPFFAHPRCIHCNQSLHVGTLTCPANPPF